MSLIVAVVDMHVFSNAITHHLVETLTGKQGIIKRRFSSPSEITILSAFTGSALPNSEPSESEALVDSAVFF